MNIAHRWKKSSFSGTETDCVEIDVHTWGEMRDSKNPTGPTLKIDVRQFVAAIKATEHDQL